MYDFTCQLATLEPPPPELQQLLGAIHGNQQAMDDFARMNAGTISPAEFFAPENVDAIRPPPRRIGASPLIFGFPARCCCICCACPVHNVCI